MTHPIFHLHEGSHRRILNLIRQHNGISGAELSRLSGMQPSSLVYILRSLASKNLICQTGTGESTTKGGKKPLLWVVHPQMGYLLGLEYLGDRSRYVLTAIDGKVAAQGAIDQLSASSGIAGDIYQTLAQVERKHPAMAQNIIAAGLAIPGIIDQVNGRIVYSAKLRTENLALADQLLPMLKYPVWLANDANAGALGERWFGGMLGRETLVFLSFNMGANNLGAGLIVDGRPYEGTHGAAGEMFGALPDMAGILKKLPENEQKLLAKALEQLPTNIGTFEKVTCLASEKLLPATRALDFITAHIANEMVNIIGLLDPAAMILGGDFSDHQWLVDEHLTPAVRARLKKKLRIGAPVPDIRLSHFGSQAVAMGAAALICQAIFNK